jgi:hypothetical protein
MRSTKTSYAGYDESTNPSNGGRAPVRRRRMSDQEFEVRLADLLSRVNGGRLDVTSFEASGVLTNNRGLVVMLPNGQEFQVTIVDSTRR